MADNNNESPRAYEFGGYRLIPDRRQLRGPDGAPVTLRGKVFDLALYLVRNRGRLVEKTELMEALWPNVVVDENNLNQAMSGLRQALGESAQSPNFIATIKGRGYQFVGDVRVIDDSDQAAADARHRTSPLPWVAAAAALGAAALLWFALNGRSVDVQNVVLDEFDQLSPRLVTDFHGSHSRPTLSPDGSMMAWVSDIDGSVQIWVRNLQQGDPIQITDGEYAANSPSWSPDNSQIIYARAGPRGTSIFSVGVLGSPPPRLLIEFGRHPSFSQRADAFVFSRGQQIWMANGDGSELRKIENLPVDQGFAERTPALSPDGNLIAFVHADAGPIGNLWVIGTEDGAQPRQLTAFDVDDLRVVRSPAFTPDGQEILFSISEKNGSGGLWRISVSGGDPVPVTSGPGDFNHPIVSANGRRVAYTDRRVSSRLVVVDTETAERKTIYESRHLIALPVASPDGSQIVFFSTLPNGAHVMTIDSDGRSLRQRTFDDDGMNTLPFFGSDGSSVYYYRGRNLVRQYLDEGRDELVLEDFHWSTRNWPAVHGDLIAFQEIDRTAGTKRAIVRDLRDGTDVILPEKMEGMTWSRDGSELLGFVRNPGGIVICEVASLDCDTVKSLGAPVSGYLPRWSRDERRIFYLRSSDDGECCTLWVVDRDGSANAPVAHLGGFESQSSYFGVTDEGDVFYNYMDSSSDEIWLVAAD